MPRVRSDSTRDLPLGVHANGCIADTDKHEDAVVREFCKAAQRRFPAEMLRPVPREDWHKHGVAINSDRTDAVDGVIESTFGAIAIEILDYSPWCDRGDVIKDDVSFAAEIVWTLGEALLDLGTAVLLCYRDVRRTGEMAEWYPFVKAVPKRKQASERQALLDELARPYP